MYDLLLPRLRFSSCYEPAQFLRTYYKILKHCPLNSIEASSRNNPISMRNIVYCRILFVRQNSIIYFTSMF